MKAVRWHDAAFKAYPLFIAGGNRDLLSIAKKDLHLSGWIRAGDSAAHRSDTDRLQQQADQLGRYFGQ